MKILGAQRYHTITQHDVCDVHEDMGEELDGSVDSQQHWAAAAAHQTVVVATVTI